MTLEEACSKTIAIPGHKTSAHLALKLACGEVDTAIVPFDEIIPRIESGEFDSGVIIHEGQLTWEQHGLHLILDLGIWWNENKRWLALATRWQCGATRTRRGGEKITEWVRMSIEHSIRNPDAALEFAIKWGRGIDEETNSKFVQMYVNERTIDYGEDGRSSIRKFLERWTEIGND